jgi:chromosome segregation ATPase
LDNAILKVNDSGLKSELEKMFSKVKVLVENYNGAKDENNMLREKVKELEQALSDTKIDISNRNSDLLNKDKELTDLKNKLLDERKNKVSGEDKAQLKQRIRELMVRLDTHLEQKANNNF